MENTRFQDLNISPERLAAIEALGWTRPTPIQAQSIPAGLEGKDVVGIAQTGTGKTAAFMIPALERVGVGKGLQVLVLCPTRELAQQVSDDTLALVKGTSIRSEAIFGGVSYGPQIKALEQGFEVIVATPGRFIDHMQSKRVDLSKVRLSGSRRGGPDARHGLPPPDRAGLSRHAEEASDHALLRDDAQRRPRPRAAHDEGRALDRGDATRERRPRASRSSSTP